MTSRLLTPDQIVTEISELRESMETSARKVLELSKTLYSHTRQTTTDGNTSAYIAYSNAWMRFAGAVSQGLRRTATNDRLLQRTRQETERQVQEATLKAAEAQRKQEKNASLAARKTVFGDLVELYGEGIVSDASR